MDTQLIGEVRWKERSFKVDGETKQFSVCLLMNESDTDSASASRWCDFFGEIARIRDLIDNP